MPHSDRTKIIGLLLIGSAVLVLATGLAWSRLRTDLSTDNAYVRGDVTALAPKVAGYITSVVVEDNQPVKAGDVLFRIDDRDYRAKLAQTAASVDAALARLENVDADIKLQHSLVRQAEAQRRSTLAELELANKASDRRHELFRTNAVSQADVDAVETTQSRAEAGVEGASATVESQKQRIAVLRTQRAAAVAAVSQARAAHDLAQIDYDSTVVRAPVGGVVGNRQARVGRFVTPGVSLLDVVPIHDLWIVANFKETQIAGIKKDQRVTITVDGFPDWTLTGVVDSFSPGSGSVFSLLPADNATGNFIRVVQRVAVKIRFAGDLSSVRLVPGLSARVRVEQGTGQ